MAHLEQFREQLRTRQGSYLPADKLADLSPSTRKLLTEWSGIPQDEVLDRVLDVRDKAWAVMPYPCIGGLRFLEFPLTEQPSYPSLVSRLTSDPSCRYLDIGCCFAPDIRALAFAGVPGAQLFGAELKNEYIELSYALFNDRSKLGARFVVGDILDESGPIFKDLKGSMDIIHMASFLHLWDIGPATDVLTNVAKLMKGNVGVTMLGRQLGADKGGVYSADGAGPETFRHDPSTMQSMFDEMGRRTGTEWMVEAEIKKAKTMAKSVDDEFGVKDRKLIWFVATRTK